jgi:hypothetical protein
MIRARWQDQDRRLWGSGWGAKERLHRALKQVIGYAVSTIEDFDPRDRSGVDQRNRGALTMSGCVDKKVSQHPFERQRPDHDLSRCLAAEAQCHAELAKLGHHHRGEENRVANYRLSRPGN